MIVTNIHRHHFDPSTSLQLGFGIIDVVTTVLLTLLLWCLTLLLFTCIFACHDQVSARCIQPQTIVSKLVLGPRTPGYMQCLVAQHAPQANSSCNLLLLGAFNASRIHIASACLQLLVFPLRHSVPTLLGTSTIGAWRTGCFSCTQSIICNSACWHLLVSCLPHPGLGSPTVW